MDKDHAGRLHRSGLRQHCEAVRGLRTVELGADEGSEIERAREMVAALAVEKRHMAVGSLRHNISGHRSLIQ